MYPSPPPTHSHTLVRTDYPKVKLSLKTKTESGVVCSTCFVISASLSIVFLCLNVFNSLSFAHTRTYAHPHYLCN